MIKETRIAPLNSLILVMDQTIGDVPKDMAGGLVTATRSCVAIGTLSQTDGETLIRLADDQKLVSGELPVFDGVLDTPNKRLSVCTVLDQPLVSLDVSGDKTRVQVWANDGSEPDDILIVATPPARLNMP